MSRIFLGSGHCSFCGQRCNLPHSGGEWSTKEGVITCCHHCAVSVLPALIADSVHIARVPSQGTPYGQLTKTLPTIMAAFWKAATARVSQKD